MRQVVGRLGDLFDRLRASLFFVPALFILGAMVLARLTTWADEALATSLDSAVVAPLIIRSTVDGARALLGTIAGATITVAGIVFSVTMLSVQLASSQFSPRVLEGFLRDRFKQNVMGFVVATFTYCLLTLAVVRIDDGGAVTEGAQRRLSVTVALALGVLAILAIVAFIDQSARSLQVGEIVRRVADETMRRIEVLHERDDQPLPVDLELPEVPGRTIHSQVGGWVQRIDVDGMLAAVPSGAVVRVDTHVGAFLPRHMPLATIWADSDDEVDERLRDAVIVGRTRTLRQDVGFGIRQLVDIALRALSPGVNDPTTANEVLEHLAGLVFEILVRDQPARVVAGDDGRRLYRPHGRDRADYVAEAFSEIRLAAAGQPAVLATLIKVLGQLIAALEADDLESRCDALRHQARLLSAELDATTLPEDEVAEIRSRAAQLAGL